MDRSVKDSTSKLKSFYNHSAPDPFQVFHSIFLPGLGFIFRTIMEQQKTDFQKPVPGCRTGTFKNLDQFPLSTSNISEHYKHDRKACSAPSSVNGLGMSANQICNKLIRGSLLVFDWSISYFWQKFSKRQ